MIPPDACAVMNFLILGEGPDELAWARRLAVDPTHRLWAVYPSLDEFEHLPPARDLDEALAIAGVDAVVVGGEPEFRQEALRRAAAAGLRIVCLHPPGPDSLAYYQVALSRSETGAIIVPDLPARLHPGAVEIRRAIVEKSLGEPRTLRLEAMADVDRDDLARGAFARDVDLIRSLFGDVEAVSATGDPAGDRPTHELIVQMRCAVGRRAEVRLAAGPRGPSGLTLNAADGTLAIEFDPAFEGPSYLTRRDREGRETTEEIPPWDARGAILSVLDDAVDERDRAPTLLDGTRDVEVAEATLRALRRGRTIDLHYEEISEAGSFKSVMTSTGCLLLIGILVVLPIALAGPSLGFGWTVYIAWAIIPILVVWVVLQGLRFAIRKPAPPPPNRDLDTPLNPPDAREQA